jgi:hypothetical protein
MGSVTGAVRTALSPDGSKLAVAALALGGTSTELSLAVFGLFISDGPIWEAAINSFNPNLRFSPDGAYLAVTTQAPTDSVSQGAPRVDVYDVETGEVRYRVEGAMACAGEIWNADGTNLVVESLVSDVPGDVAVDLATGTITPLRQQVTPSPFDPSIGVGFDGSDFTIVPLDGSAPRQLSDTTVSPAWWPDHEPLFTSSSLVEWSRVSGQGSAVYAYPHGGHGGCGEGAQILAPPSALRFIEDPPPD